MRFISRVDKKGPSSFGEEILTYLYQNSEELFGDKSEKVVDVSYVSEFFLLPSNGTFCQF